MNRALKFFSRLVVIVGILYILVMLLLSVFVKTKAFTPMIEKLVHEKTGQTVQIDGDVSLSVFPWPAIKGSHITINNPKEFQAPASIKYFAKIDGLSIHLHIINLFHKNIQLSNVSISKADVNLVTSETGKENWAGFVQKKKSTTSSSPSSSQIENITQLPSIHVSDSSIHLINLKTKSHIDITHLSLNSSNTSVPNHRNIHLIATIDRKDPKTQVGLNFKGILSLNPNKQNITFDHLNLITQISYLTTKPITLTTRGSFTIHNDNVKAVINTTGEDVVGGNMNANADLFTQGKTFENWIQNLSGKGNLKINNGKIKGFHMSSNMNFLRLPQIPTVISFKIISADYQINNGQVNVDNFLMDASPIKVTGKGQINLPNTTINAQLLAAYANKSNWQIPLKVTGSLFKPNIRPNTTNMTEKLLQKEIKNGFDKIKKQLKGLFN